jgi:hypothetical protein
VPRRHSFDAANDKRSACWYRGQSQRMSPFGIIEPRVGVRGVQSHGTATTI